MAPKVIADFVGQLRRSGANQFHKSRVLLSPQQLLLVAPDGRQQVALDRLFGVTASDVDPELQQFFDELIQLSYRHGDGTQRAWIRAQPETLERFQQVLFKALLGSKAFSVHHPVCVGGRLCGPSNQTARPKFGQSTTAFVADKPVWSLDHATIVRAVPGNQTPAPVSGPALTVFSVRNKTAYTTVVTAEDKRLLNLLRCHLEINARHNDDVLRKLGLSTEAVQGLVWLYAGGDGGSLPRALVDEAASPEQILEELFEADLVTNDEETIELTHRGLAAASVCFASHADELA